MTTGHSSTASLVEPRQAWRRRTWANVVEVALGGGDDACRVTRILGCETGSDGGETTALRLNTTTDFSCARSASPLLHPHSLCQQHNNGPPR